MRSLWPIGVALVVILTVTVGAYRLEGRKNLVAQVNHRLVHGATFPNSPAAGEIWFGSEVDDVFNVHGHTSTVGRAEQFVAAVYTRVKPGSRVREYRNGQLVRAFPLRGSPGQSLVLLLGPLLEPGTWRFEVTDSRGNVVASGEVTVT